MATASATAPASAMRQRLRGAAPAATPSAGAAELVLFVPLMWLAAQFWNPLWVAAVGVVFLVGRHLYWRGYVKHPDQRMLGNVMSLLPVGVFLLATLVGLGRVASD